LILSSHKIQRPPSEAAVASNLVVSVVNYSVTIKEAFFGK
jgi:hypothetical protein